MLHRIPLVFAPGRGWPSADGEREVTKKPNLRSRTIEGRLAGYIERGGYNVLRADWNDDDLDPGGDAYERLGVRRTYSVIVFFDNVVLCVEDN